MKPHKRRILLLTLLVLIVLISRPAWLTYRELRQERLNHALATAIEKNDTIEALTLLRQGADPNTHNNFDADPTLRHYWNLFLNRLRGYPPPQHVQGPPVLLRAVERNNATVVRALLAHGARDVNTKSAEGNPLVICADDAPNHDIVRMLLEYGADINATSEGHQTLLLLATQLGQTDFARYLLERGADPNGSVKEGVSPLYIAAATKNRDLVKLLIAKGVNVNVEDTMNTQCSSALSWAAANGDKEMVDLLLAHGAHVDSCAKFGTALTHAAKNGNVPIVRSLLAHGADPNRGDDLTPLPLWITSHGKLEILDMLLRAGADLHAAGRDGTTLLMAAVASGDLSRVKRLLACHPDINAKRWWDSETALMNAAGGGHTAIVDLLIRHGANVNLWGNCDEVGETALTLAAHEGHLEIVKHLLRHGAHLKTPGQYGKVALICAVEGGTDIDDNGKTVPPNPAVVAYLLAHGARVNARDATGNTALKQAKSKRLPAIIRLLKQHGARE